MPRASTIAREGPTGLLGQNSHLAELPVCDALNRRQCFHDPVVYVGVIEFVLAVVVQKEINHGLEDQGLVIVGFPSARPRTSIGAPIADIGGDHVAGNSGRPRWRRNALMEWTKSMRSR